MNTSSKSHYPCMYEMCWQSHSGATEPGGSWVVGGLLIVKKKEKVGSAESRGERKADRQWDREVRGYGPSVSCRGLQMALRIKSKLCWLPRNGLCDTSGATWEGGKTGAEGGGWRRGAAAVEWKSPSNEFLKYLKINCLWKSSADSWYAGWMGAKWKVALSLHFSSSQPLLYLGIIHFLTLTCRHGHACRYCTNIRV